MMIRPYFDLGLEGNGSPFDAIRVSCMRFFNERLSKYHGALGCTSIARFEVE